MSTAVQPKVTVTAHRSHWGDILKAIFAAISAANPILATFVPAPVEAGIQIATTLEPTVAAAVESVTVTSPAP